MIPGTVYFMDEPHLDVLKTTLSSMYPPGKGFIQNTMICMDLDESDNMLEVWFPDHCQKATLLCPPPSVMFKEIDGDPEGFVREYNQYLEYDSTVQEFISSILYFLHIGGHIIFYTPSYLNDDVLWMNTLQLFFFTKYGITIGTSENNPFMYDARYNSVIADTLFGNSYIDILEYSVYCGPVQNDFLQNKIFMEYRQYCAPEDNPLIEFNKLKDHKFRTGILLCPGISIE